MVTVKDILAKKGAEIVSIGPDATVLEALVKMSEINIGAILIKNAEGKIAGIFSERDFARKIIVKGRSCEVTKVKEIMTSEPLCIEPSTSLQDCMKVMTARKFRHLPVKKGDHLVGVISIGDVVKALIEEQGQIISEQAFAIGQMERTEPGAV